VEAIVPRASGRLDLIVARQPPEARGEVAPALQALGRARGWWDDLGHAGPNADALVPGGFAAARSESSDREALVANQQGGFSVRCPACGAVITRGFSLAVEAHRRGGERVVVCPACGAVHDLVAADVRPPAAFTRFALHLMDVMSAEIQPDALAEIVAVLGSVVVIGRRVG
jgi:hypothetical protein